MKVSFSNTEMTKTAFLKAKVIPGKLISVMVRKT